MDPAPPDSGLLSGRYRLGNLLGRGGMAEVYDGFDERLARPVAIKILRPSAVDDPAMRARFEREARSAARLSHPAVVAVFDSGEDRGRAYLVMERLPGETLADRIRLGPLDQRWLAPVLGDVLGALGAAHALGMVHRDIKPANILLAADGRAKVADFGIAKIYQDNLGARDREGDDLTATGLILGTVAYLSPEQIGGAPASPQGDIYAVGVVAYEALSGRKPFVGEDAIAQARAVADGRTADLAAGRPDVDPRLAAVVRRAMSRRVEDRYPSTSAMLADLVATGLTIGDAPNPDATVPLAPPIGATVAMAGPELTAALPPRREPDPTRILAPPRFRAAGVAAGRPAPAPAPSRRHAGLIGALITLAVVVAAAAVIAVLVSRNNASTTIPPGNTTPVTTATSVSTATTAPTTTLAPTTTATTLPTTTATTTPTTLSPTTTTPATTTPATTIPTTTIPTTTTPTTAPTTATTPTTPTTGPTTAATTASVAAASKEGPPKHRHGKRRHG